MLIQPIIHLLQLSQYPILAQLQLEEALLRADDRSWCIVNFGTPPAIVMGISGQSEAFINDEKIRNSPLPIIKRFSGGGTVIVDENTLFITFICNAKTLNVPCYPEKVLQWTAQFYETVFPKGFHLRENDYAIGERKFGGNAQYFRKDRWLHHSSLLWNFHPDRMEYLLQPVKKPKYRNDRNHLDFLCTLHEHEDKPQNIQNNLMQALSSHFQVIEKELEEVIEVINRPHRKATQLLEGSAIVSDEKNWGPAN